MPLIEFPNIPDVPGVPAILRSVTVPTSIGQLQNIVLSALQQAIFRWGVFDKGGVRALDPDSFMGIDYRKDTPIANHPQEQGGFQAYNKVQTPFDCRVRLVFGGDKQSRAAALERVETMQAGVELFDVVTPEKTYLNVNLVNMDMRRRTEGGASMLTLDLWFSEVRITAASQYSNPKTPSAYDPTSNGQVQSFPLGTEPGGPLILASVFQ